MRQTGEKEGNLYLYILVLLVPIRETASRQFLQIKSSVKFLINLKRIIRSNRETL